ncbi:MAG: signal peptidase I [Promethearchaeia archaeon]
MSSKKYIKSKSKKKKKDNSKASKKKIIIAVILIFFAFFGSYIIYFALQVSLGTNTPMVVVISGSMEPNIHKGDLLFLTDKEPENIKEGTIEDQQGDVIVYDARGLWPGAPDEPIVHRVVDQKQNESGYFFLTKGDANSYPDRAWVPANRIIGVVCGGIPYIGWIKIFLTEYNLFIPLLVIFGSLLIISIIWDIYQETEEEQKEKNANEKVVIKKEDP